MDGLGHEWFPENYMQCQGKYLRMKMYERQSHTGETKLMAQEIITAKRKTEVLNCI